MKKPRKEMRMNRRKMKAELNRLRRMENRIHEETVHVETCRAERVVNIFDAGSKDLLTFIQKDMIKEMCAGLEQNGYITFTMTKEPSVCGVRITAEIKTVIQ